MDHTSPSRVPFDWLWEQFSAFWVYELVEDTPNIYLKNLVLLCYIMRFSVNRLVHSKKSCVSF